MQLSLFDNVKPLFQGKPLVLVLSKTDLTKFSDLAQSTQEKFQQVAQDHNAYLIQMSNSNGEGIADVKTKACDILLDYRLLHKSKDTKKLD